MACAASEIVCLIFGVTVGGNPQIVNLQKGSAVELAPVVGKCSVLEKSLKPKLCTVRVFFFQIAAAFHFFAIRFPSAIRSDHNICLLSFCLYGKGTYRRRIVQLVVCIQEEKVFSCRFFYPGISGCSTAFIILMKYTDSWICCSTLLAHLPRAIGRPVIYQNNFQFWIILRLNAPYTLCHKIFCLINRNDHTHKWIAHYFCSPLFLLLYTKYSEFHWKRQQNFAFFIA